MSDTAGLKSRPSFPNWVPDTARTYLAHVETGQSIRSLAREAGCHASTILRVVRRVETRRDDPLVDLALRRLGGAKRAAMARRATEMGADAMTFHDRTETGPVPSDAKLKTEALRVLRRMNEPGAVLAIAAEMDNGVVARDMADGQTLTTTVVERAFAEAMALKDWIKITRRGRITRYCITSAGRLALKRFLAEEEAMRVGLGEGADPHSEQHRDWVTRNGSGDANRRRGIRYTASESPVQALARRKDRKGEAFLSPEMVAAAERLREDFELAQMGPRITQNWEKFLAAGARGSFPGGNETGGSQAARDRVNGALADLGPGLGDVVLRCCCFLDGMEAVERHMGWSARSGKIVLRIALTRLKRHYDEKSGGWSPLIG